MKVGHLTRNLLEEAKSIITITIFFYSKNKILQSNYFALIEDISIVLPINSYCYRLCIIFYHFLRWDNNPGIIHTPNTILLSTAL